MNLRFLSGLMGLLLPLASHAAKTVQGTIKGLDGHPLETGTLHLDWLCEGCQSPQPHTLGADGKFSFRNLDPFGHSGLFRFDHAGKNYTLGRLLSPAEGTPLVLTLAITNTQVNPQTYRLVDAGQIDQVLNRKVATSFPSGNLVVNGSFEAESYAFAGSATHGWVGYWGATVTREKTGTTQFGNWALVASTTSANSVGQFQGAEYVITEEDPAFAAIQRANVEGKPVIFSAWVRGGAGAMGKAVVLDDIFVQGNDAPHVFSDTHWHKLTYAFTNIQVHPNTFAFRHFGFSVHEKDPSGDAFTFEVDNVQLSIGGEGEPSPAAITVDISDGAAKVLQTEVLREDPATSGVIRSVAKAEFDSIGRPWRTWLPFEEPCSGAECMNPSTTDPNSVYQGGSNGLPNAGGFAYSQAQYESDPLARTFQSSSSGARYSPSSEHLDRISHSGTSDLSESLLGANRAEPDNSGNAVYSYSHVKDANGHETMVWKDQLGNAVKSTAYDPGRTGFVSSRIVYDDKNRLIRALPPISCESPEGVATPGINCVTPRKFEYNPSGQMTKEISPDFGTVKSLYNLAGQLRVRQTPVQAGHGEFTVYKYNERAQLLEAGIMNGDYDRLGDRAFLQNAVVGSGLTPNPQKFVFTSLGAAFPAIHQWIGQVSKATPFTIYQVYYSPGEVLFPEIESEFMDAVDKDGRRVDIDMEAVEYGSVQYAQLMQARNGSSAPTGIEDPEWPLAGAFQLQIRNVYDGLANLPEDVKAGGVPFIIPIGENPGAAKGRLVAEINYNPHLASYFADPQRRIVSTFYRYDRTGNIQTTFNYIGSIKTASKRIQETDMTYDQSNRLVSKTSWKHAAGAACADMSGFQKYAYDTQGRLSKVYTNEKADCTQEIQIASYNYGLDGNIASIGLGQPQDGITVLYAYHIRGWMKNITARQVSCGSPGVCNPTTIFSEDLRYDEGMTSDFSEPQFNGTVAEKLYYLGKTSEHRAFVYNYDGMDRLLRSYYTADKSDADYLDEESEYLADGRLKTMKRGNVTQSVPQPYKYYPETNKLKCIDDDIDRVTSLKKDRKCLGADHSIPRYIYDANGNRVSASIDGGQAIDFDWRDMPWRITKGADQILMVYDAAGNRVSKFEFPASGGVTAPMAMAIHYVGGDKEIREPRNGDDDVEFVNLQGVDGLGRISQTGDKEFFIKDYLGSTITKFSDGGGWINSSHYDYFPYGKQSAAKDASPSITGTFTGKELDEGSGLYYFGARYYDADIGMWVSPDPAREFHSPYAYSPNPINTVDPDGLDSRVVITNESKEMTGYKGGQAYQYSAYKAEIYNNTEKWYNRVFDFFGWRDPNHTFWVGRDDWGTDVNNAVVSSEGYTYPSQGNVGGPKGWLMIGETKEYTSRLTGVSQHSDNHVWGGVSFHQGYPKNSHACITLRPGGNWPSFKNALRPDLNAHKEIKVIFKPFTPQTRP